MIVLQASNEGAVHDLLFLIFATLGFQLVMKDWIC